MGNVFLSFGYYIERPYGAFADSAYGKAALKKSLSFAKKLLGFLDSKEAPRTLFILGEHLKKCRENCDSSELRKIYDVSNPLNEIQQHTYSHVAVKEILPEGKCAISSQEFYQDALNANSIIYNILGANTSGLGLPYGYSGDLSSVPEVLETLKKLGIDYVSSDTRNENSLEGPMTLNRQPHTYAEIGYPEIAEIPSHGLQDVIFTEEKRGVFKSKEYKYNDIISHYCSVLEKAQKIQEEKSPVYVALCLHPWAIMEYDPELKIQDALIDAAEDRGIELVSYGTISDNVRVRQNNCEIKCP